MSIEKIFPLIRMNWLLLSVFVLIGFAQTDKAVLKAENPLEQFAQLIGGEWHLEGSYQVYEWGVGKKSVKASGFFIVDGKPKLVSEGFWFWHPGERKIKGYFTAIDMPVVFYDYTTRFEERRMISELKAYSPGGREMSYTEIYEFIDEKNYQWSLLKDTGEGLKEVMGGVFERK